MIRATVITDASFDDRDNSAGWAAWVRVDGIKEPIKKYGAFKEKVKTSTDAEKKAALNGIAIAKSFGADVILLQSDCLAVIHLIDGTTKKTSAIAQWNQWREICGLIGVRLHAKHVKGHTKTKDARSYVNRWCDEKANAARKMSAE